LIVDFTRAIRCKNDDRFVASAQGAHFGDCDLKVGEQFQQKALKFFVGTIQFVDQEHGRTLVALINRLA